VSLTTDTHGYPLSPSVNRTHILALNLQYLKESRIDSAEMYVDLGY